MLFVDSSRDLTKKSLRIDLFDFFVNYKIDKIIIENRYYFYNKT